MALYQHRFLGHCAAGDIFVFSWWSETSVTIDTSHSNAVTWVTNLWNGPGGSDGYETLTPASVGVDRVTTGEITILTGQQQALRESDVTIAGTSASPALPAEVALVVSLRTPLANRTGRGRFYLPQPATNVLTATGLLSTAAQDTVMNALSFAWTASNAAGENPVVYSRTARATRTITSFNVGNVLDIQTRRQNSLVESRDTAAMP
jgi:hypothetical protein